jgi:hypothetical protein
MSLASAYAAIQAGCTAVPQHGYFATEAPDLYQVKIWQGNRRVFYRFNYPLTLVWECPSPPAIVRIFMYEHPEITVNTGPILTITTFLGECGSPGCFLGTPLWFQTVGLAYHFATQTAVACDLVHLQNWKTNTGSVGFYRYDVDPPYPC